MFELSNDIAILKTRVRHLEQRKARLMAASGSDDSSGYWFSSDLARIDEQLREARVELAEKEGTGA